MPRATFHQLAPEYPVMVDRYCSDDGREDRQNVMMMSCAAWAAEAGCEIELLWEGEPAPVPAGGEGGAPRAVFLVLFSVAAYRLKNAIAAYRALGDCRVIVCGPHAVSFPEHCFRAGADAVVGRCDRELFLEILRDAFGGTLQRRYETVRQITAFPTQARFRELGLLPRQSFMNVVASTGCPYTCDFCSDATTAYSALPPDDTLRNIRSSDEPIVVFNDPLFGVGKGGRALLAGLRDLTDRYCVGFTTSSLLRDAAFRRSMGDARFVLIEIGLENINSQFAKNKNTDFFEAFPDCDFLILVNYIWGYDPRDFNGETRRFLLSLSRRCPNVFPMVFVPFSLPETGLHHTPQTAERLFDPSYLCIGNEILSMRVAGASSPRDYYAKLAELNGEIYDGHAGRMRAWIEDNPRLDASRRQVLHRMIDRHLAEAELLDQWSSLLAESAPDAYEPFSQEVLRRSVPGFERYDLAL